jgi:hypothetical protein
MKSFHAGSRFALMITMLSMLPVAAAEAGQPFALHSHLDRRGRIGQRSASTDLRRNTSVKVVDWARESHHQGVSSDCSGDSRTTTRYLSAASRSRRSISTRASARASFDRHGQLATGGRRTAVRVPSTTRRRSQGVQIGVVSIIKTGAFR